MKILKTSFEARTLIFFVLSVVVLFFLRGIWTIPIEVAGDAVRKFYAGAEIARTGDWSILLQNHHTMRWSIIIPQTFLTWAIGTRYEVYYILPLLTFACYFVLVLYALKDHLSTSQIVLLGVLLFADPMSFRNTSQLMTAGPGVFYAVSACFVLAAYSNKNQAGTILAGALFFCAYGSHATYISFAAGGFLWLVFIQRSWKSSIIFLSTLLSLLVVECLVFNYISEWNLTFGRIEALFLGTHLDAAPGESVALRQLFTRWLQLPVLDIAYSVTFFISGLVYISLRPKPAVPAFISCVYLVGLCFAFFVSFALVSINPISPVQPLLPRFLSPFLPFAIIIFVYSLALIAESHSKPKDMLIYGFAMLLAFTIIVAPEVFDHPKYPRIKIRPAFFLWKAEKEYTNFAQQIHDGDLVYNGRKQYVVHMLTQFKFPIQRPQTKPEAIETNRSLHMKCVSKLVDIPSRHNVRKCKPEKL